MPSDNHRDICDRDTRRRTTPAFQADSSSFKLIPWKAKKPARTGEEKTKNDEEVRKTRCQQSETLNISESRISSTEDSEDDP